MSARCQTCRPVLVIVRKSCGAPSDYNCEEPCLYEDPNYRADV